MFIHSFSNRKYILKTPCTIFHRYYSGTFHVVRNPHRISIFGCVFKPEAAEGISKQKIVTRGWTKFGHKGDYQNIN